MYRQRRTTTTTFRRRSLGLVGSAADGRQRVRDPVDDVEEQERRRETLARHFVDAARPSLARLDVDRYRVLLPVRAPGTVQTLHRPHNTIYSGIFFQLSARG